MTSATAQPKADQCQVELARRMLRQMLLIRRFEEKAAEAYALGKIGGFCHLYIGQEAVAAGSLAALRHDDYVISSYREHGQALVRGVSAKAAMAELYGKATGCSKGKGGSMHLFDAAKRFMGGHGIVGGHVPLAAGIGFAIKYQGGDQVCLCYFGEAAVNIGAFHEALNMSSVYHLPVIFCCENNRYGMGTAFERVAAVTDVVEHACSYDMAAELVNGMDALAVNTATQRAVERARQGGHPTLLGCARTATWDTRCPTRCTECIAPRTRSRNRRSGIPSPSWRSSSRKRVRWIRRGSTRSMRRCARRWRRR